jgi:hypothetical protein
MSASGQQLGEITRLIEAGHIRPVVDRVFPFEQTRQALDYVETGRAKGKVVIKVRRRRAPCPSRKLPKGRVCRKSAGLPGCENTTSRPRFLW